MQLNLIATNRSIYLKQKVKLFILGLFDKGKTKRALLKRKNHMEKGCNNLTKVFNGGLCDATTIAIEKKLCSK